MQAGVTLTTVVGELEVTQLVHLLHVDVVLVGLVNLMHRVQPGDVFLLHFLVEDFPLVRLKDCFGQRALNVLQVGRKLGLENPGVRGPVTLLTQPHDHVLTLVHLIKIFLFDFLTGVGCLAL